MRLTSISKGRFIVTGITLAVAIAVHAESVPYVFSPGTPAKSSEVNANFNYLTDHQVTRTVIEGTIDTSQNGDVVKVINYDTYATNVNVHWKIVDVPQVTLTNMPMVWVYMKACTNAPDLPGTNNWMPLNYGSIKFPLPNVYSTVPGMNGRGVPCFTIDDGKVYIFYKCISPNIGTNIPTTGDYKIIVVK